MPITITPLQQVLVAKAAFAEPANAVKDVPLALAIMRPYGLPHSLYEELWHVAYWLRFSLALVRGEQPAMPAHSSGLAHGQRRFERRFTADVTSEDA